MATAVLLLGALVALLGNTSPSYAQSPEIDEIRVVGTQRIDPATVMSYMTVRPGDRFDAERADQSLKELFGTGLFADVTLRREGDALIVQVVENPIINRIAFEGAKRVKPEQLEPEISLRPRVVFTRAKVQSDVSRILEIYRQTGRFAAQVEPKIIQLPENRVDLVFEIDEGPTTGIRSINFIGNERFGDRTLRREVQTEVSAFYRFFSQDDTYDPDRLTFDRELLRRFYLSQGYADFRVVSAVAELTADREDFIITFTVDEGQRYTFGAIDVSSELRDLDPAFLRGSVSTRDGTIYNADLVEESVNVLGDLAGAQGFAFAEVRPRVTRDREARTIDVTYEIREGPRVAVERIDISGNVRTLDRVLRREFQIVEGDAFNAANVRRTQQRLQNLGFFQRVEVSSAPGSAPDRTIINVDVEEQSTGEISIGAGFSTSSGPLADLSIRERNLLGKGQDLRLGLSLALRQQEIDLSFTEPFFLERDLSAGFDVFRRLTDFTDESSFKEDEIGAGVRTGFQLTPRLRQNVSYSLVQDEIFDVNSDASRVIREQEGKNIISKVSTGLFLDALDARFNPSNGYFLSYDADLAGLGGDIKFFRNRASAGFFRSVFSKQIVIGFDAEIGYIAGLGDKVRLVDRFFLGGDNLRGFETAGAGPRDLASPNEDSLGGNVLANGTVEARFPLGLPEELGILGSLFTDVGLLTDNDDSGAGVVDEGSIRLSVGFGLSWRSPFGPVRVDVSAPLLKEDFDKTETLRLNFGTRF